MGAPFFMAKRVYCHSPVDNWANLGYKTPITTKIQAINLMVTKRKLTPGKLAKPAIKTTSTAAPKPAIAAVEPKTTPAVMVRRKELVERIVASSGLKPNAVKSVLDAVLVEMGDALSAGEGLNIHPLGKITVNRAKKLEDREILVCKIRRKVVAPEANPYISAAE